MQQSEVNRFNKLYQQHLRSLKLQGKAQKTIDAYSRAIRRVSNYFDCCPDKLNPEQLEVYFADEIYVRCPECGHGELRPMSCGHRNCPKCQNTEKWIFILMFMR